MADAVTVPRGQALACLRQALACLRQTLRACGRLLACLRRAPGEPAPDRHHNGIRDQAGRREFPALGVMCLTAAWQLMIARGLLVRREALKKVIACSRRGTHRRIASTRGRSVSTHCRAAGARCRAAGIRGRAAGTRRRATVERQGARRSSHYDDRSLRICGGGAVVDTEPVKSAKITAQLNVTSTVRA